MAATVPQAARAGAAPSGSGPPEVPADGELQADAALLELGSLAAARERAMQLLERVGLSPFRNKLLRTFSKGMLQRIGLAQALLNRPALVFLDEPTSGLDPVGRRLVPQPG